MPQSLQLANTTSLKRVVINTLSMSFVGHIPKTNLPISTGKIILTLRH